jgi:hypothetical protein
MKQLHTYSTNVLTIIGILSLIGFILMLTSCESSSIDPSDEVVKEKLTVQEQAFVNNIGELHNYAIKKLYEKHREEIGVILNSREGLEKMADILLKESINSKLWSLPKHESYDLDKVVSVIEAIYLGRYESIDNYQMYAEFFLFNFNSESEILKNYSNLEDYKIKISNLIRDFNNEHYISDKEMEKMMKNVIEASTTLWEEESLIFSSKLKPIRFVSNGSIFLNKKQLDNRIIQGEESYSRLNDFVCRNGTIIADAEGVAIGGIVGGFIGGAIGGALASVVYNEAEHNSGICGEEDED